MRTLITETKLKRLFVHKKKALQKSDTNGKEKAERGRFQSDDPCKLKQQPLSKWTSLPDPTPRLQCLVSVPSLALVLLSLASAGAKGAELAKKPPTCIFLIVRMFSVSLDFF